MQMQLSSPKEPISLTRQIISQQELLTQNLFDEL